MKNILIINAHQRYEGFAEGNLTQSVIDSAEKFFIEHNFSTDDAIGVVATALRKHVDERNLDRVLENFPEGSVEFWSAIKIDL